MADRVALPVEEQYANQVNSTLGQIKQFYPYLAPTPELSEYIQSEIKTGKHPGDIASAILQNPTSTGEIALGAKNYAQTQLAPGYNSQLLNNQQAQNQQKLNLQQLNQNGLDINRNYDVLGQNLQQQAQRSNQGLQERFNQLGLLQRG